MKYVNTKQLLLAVIVLALSTSIVGCKVSEDQLAELRAQGLTDAQLAELGIELSKAEEAKLTETCPFKEMRKNGDRTFESKYACTTLEDGEIYNISFFEDGTGLFNDQEASYKIKNNCTMRMKVFNNKGKLTQQVEMDNPVFGEEGELESFRHFHFKKGYDGTAECALEENKPVLAQAKVGDQALEKPLSDCAFDQMNLNGNSFATRTTEYRCTLPYLYGNTEDYGFTFYADGAGYVTEYSNGTYDHDVEYEYNRDDCTMTAFKKSDGTALHRISNLQTDGNGDVKSFTTVHLVAGSTDNFACSISNL